MAPVSNIEKPLQELKSTSKQPQWKIAEECVKLHFEQQGFLLIEKHFQTPFAEIDLFMKHSAGLFIIEVKAVSSFEMLERVKYSQQFERLKRAHLYLSAEHDENVYPILAVVEGFKSLYIFEEFL